MTSDFSTDGRFAEDSRGRDPGGPDDGIPRRRFLAAVGAGTGSLALGPGAPARFGGAEGVAPPPPAEARGSRTNKAVVRAAFIYPPSSTFASDPDGWWSWPGNEFDAEGRHRRYAAELRAMEARLGVRIDLDDRPVASVVEARRLAEEIRKSRPDGLLLVLFYNRSIEEADLLLRIADEARIPTIFFIGLGVKHGPVDGYRRPGVYLIQSLDNLDAIESGLRMIRARKAMASSRLLSIVDAEEPREGVEAFLGTTVRVVPFSRYVAAFREVPSGPAVRELVEGFVSGARERRGLSAEALENAARAHLAILRLLEEERAQGVTMNCLSRGMLKPCMCFSTLNGSLVPAACENDLPALYTQLLGQLLTGRPGFQHNPCYETEKNHYYASHCTCPTRLHGPEGPAAPYLLRRFAHTNEGSCAIQVFWTPGEPVTMVRYYPAAPSAGNAGAPSGEGPGGGAALDVYAGRVVASHPMPPAAGCTTNVEVEITDRDDALSVKGHHNVIFCGDFARRFRLFAQLYRMRLAETGFKGPWPA